MNEHLRYFLVINWMLITCLFSGAQTISNASNILDSDAFCETVSAVFKEYPIQFSNVKGVVSYQSSAIMKWNARLCVPNAVECLVSSNKVPKDALYWRCKILQVDSLEEAHSLFVRLVDRVKKCSRPFSATFESNEPLPPISEISDSYIHVMKCNQPKDSRYKDLIVAASMVREKSIGKWSLILTIGKTEYEF